MDDKQKKMLLVGAGGIAVLGVAYVMSMRKSSASGDAQGVGASVTPLPQQSPNAVVPIPALLAQASQKGANNISTSNPIPVTTTPPAIESSGSGVSGLQGFYSKFGLRAYTANDPEYSRMGLNYNAVDTATGILVPNYVVDKTTLLQHYGALKQSGANYGDIDSRISSITAIQ